MSSSFTNIYGFAIPDSVTAATFCTPHDWTADSTGLFQTATNLATEWKSDYAAMLAGNGASLTAVQRLEGNAEAVFENTGLSKLSAAQQEIDRSDAQRQFDAMGAAMQIDQARYGISANAPLTEQSYLQLEQTIQSSPVLEELAMQGHGLNNSGISRYAGYTTDFQNNVDSVTRFVGGGIVSNNRNALTDFFDDNVLSHVPFPVVYEHGHLEQLNQNGNGENTLNNAIVALNDSMFIRTYTSVDFLATTATWASNKASNAEFYTKSDQAALAALVAAEAVPAPAGEVKTLTGALISNSMTFNDANGIVHTWTADSAGLFTTTTDLAAEWHAAYVDLVTTGGKDLSAEQRLEANAEAVFENTGLKSLSAAQQQMDREDAQRQFDAEFAAIASLGFNPSTALTAIQYLQVEHALQGNAAWEQLAIEGHGLNNPPSPIYNGYTEDFQNNVDQTTIYVGSGYNHNQKAIADFFDDSVLGHLPFPVVIHNGKLVQLNQNGAGENSLATAVGEFNRAIHTGAFDARDFKQA